MSLAAIMWEILSEERLSGLCLSALLWSLKKAWMVWSTYPQISDKRIGKPDDVLKKGQEVEAKVLDVNESEQRISLSIRKSTRLIRRKPRNVKNPRKGKKRKSKLRLRSPTIRNKNKGLPRGQKPREKKKATRKTIIGKI